MGHYNDTPYSLPGDSSRENGSNADENGQQSQGQERMSFSTLYKKTEKLSAAVHMVTSFVSDSEPAKWRLRENSLSLLYALLAMHSSNTYSEKEELAQHINMIIEETLSLLVVARVGRVVSEMNARVLEQEYQELRAHLGEWMAEEGGVYGLISKLLREDISPRNIMPPMYGADASMRMNTNDTDINSAEEEWRALIQKDTDIKGHNDVFYNNAEKDTGSDKGHSAPSGRRTSRAGKAGKDRGDIIVALAKKKGEITVKDVAAVIKDCSEKTLQRELLALVRKDVLNKHGEKRWSRYSLKGST